MISKEKSIPVPLTGRTLDLAKDAEGLQWQKLGGMAVHEDADWNQEVCRASCMTLKEAKAFAAADDRITFFFYVKHYAVMSRHQILHAGDVVFFTGVPILGTEPGADTYEKPAANQSIFSISAAPDNSWVSIQAKLKVPDYAGNKSLSYLWPGLQPGGRHSPAVHGGLQPVLSFCVPQEAGISDLPVTPESGWWISGQYLHAEHRQQAAYTCYGGPRMEVSPGDVLTSSIIYDASTKTWIQTIHNMANKRSVSYPMSLKQQVGQNLEKNTLHFFLKNLAQHAGAHLGQCLSLFNVVAKVAQPQSNLGQDLLGLPHVDSVSLSEDQTTLSIGRIILYSPSLNAG